MSTYRIMTLNMQTDRLYSFGDSRFSFRIQAINEMIRMQNPDLIGVQELTENMFSYLDTVFSRYAMVGEGRHSRFADEYSAILYRKDRFEVLEEQTFWLSDTPLKKGSRYRLSQFPRITTFALFRDLENGYTFSLFNTHLDHLFPGVRRRQAEVLRSLIIENQSGLFTAVTGDFNDVPGSGPLMRICSAGLNDTSDNKLCSTLRGKLGSMIQHNLPIDHILLNKWIDAYQLTKIDKKYSGYWPSDHYPLIIEFNI